MSLIVSLRPPALLRDNGDRGLTVETGSLTLPFPNVTSGLVSAFRRLGGDGTPAAEIADAILRAEGERSLERWYYYLNLLEQSSAVWYTVRRANRVLARLSVTSEHFRGMPDGIDPKHRYTWSRFVCSRRDGPNLIIESPLSLARVELLDPAVSGWLAGLIPHASATELASVAGGGEADAVRELIELLDGVGMLTTVRDDGTTAEDADPSLTQWEFADALFHARSRHGRHDNPMGRVFPFRGRVDALPVTKPPMSDRVIELWRPDQRDDDDPGFARVLARRRSIRAHGALPLTFAQLGEFLFRAARIQQLLPPNPDTRPYAASLRPTPSGGACHPLELYLVVRTCDGLAPGLYHYDPLRHRLEVITEDEGMVRRLLAGCPPPADGAAPWQVLVIVAARFQRVSWKYRGISYATILKDTGALLQTLYLVATAMELAPCALGGGDAELFARTIDTSYFEETSVGEFLLGTRPSASAVHHEECDR